MTTTMMRSVEGIHIHLELLLAAPYVFALPSDVATAIMRLLQCGHRVASLIPPPYFPRMSEWNKSSSSRFLFGF